MEVEGKPSRSSLSTCPLPCNLASLLSMNCRARAEGIARRLQTQIITPAAGAESSVKDKAILVPPDWGESLVSFQDGRSFSVDDDQIDAFHRTSELNNLRPIHVVTSEPTLHLCLPQPPRELHPSPEHECEQDSDVHYDFDLVTPEDMMKTYSCSPSESPVTWELNYSRNGERDTPNEDARGAEKPESGCVTSVTSPILFSEEYDEFGLNAASSPYHDDAEDQGRLSDANLEAVREILSTSSLSHLPPDHRDEDQACSNIAQKDPHDVLTLIEKNKCTPTEDTKTTPLPIQGTNLKAHPKLLECPSSPEEIQESPSFSTKRKKPSKRKHKHKKNHSRYSTRSDSSGDSSLEAYTVNSPSRTHEIPLPEEVVITDSKDYKRIYSGESGMCVGDQSPTYDDRFSSVSPYEYCELCEKEALEYRQHKSRKNENSDSKTRSPPKKNRSKSSRQKEVKSNLPLEKSCFETLNAQSYDVDRIKIEIVNEATEIRTDGDSLSMAIKKYDESSPHQLIEVDKENQTRDDKKTKAIFLEQSEHEDKDNLLSKKACNFSPREFDPSDSKEGDEAIERDERPEEVSYDTAGKLFIKSEAPRDLEQVIMMSRALGDEQALESSCQEEKQQHHLSFTDSWDPCENQVPDFDSGNSSFRDCDYELTVFDTHFSCLYGGSYPLSDVTSPMLSSAMPCNEGQSKVSQTQPKTLAPLSLSSGYSSQTTGSSVSFSPPVWSSEQVRHFKSESSSKDLSLSGPSSPGELKLDPSLSLKCQQENPVGVEKESQRSSLDGDKLSSSSFNDQLNLTLDEFNQQTVVKEGSSFAHLSKIYSSAEKTSISPSPSHPHKCQQEFTSSASEDEVFYPKSHFVNGIQPFHVFESSQSSIYQSPSEINCISISLEDGTSVLEVAKDISIPSQILEDNHSSATKDNVIPSNACTLKNDRPFRENETLPKLGGSEEDNSGNYLRNTVCKPADSQKNIDDTSTEAGSEVDCSKMKSEESSPSRRGARRRRRDFNCRISASSRTEESEQVRNEASDKMSTSATKETPKPEKKALAEVVTEDKQIPSTLPSSPKKTETEKKERKKGSPTSASIKGEDQEEIETLPEGALNNVADEVEEEDIEEEALLTGKFKNIRKYSERVRRLSDDDDNLPPPPTQVYIIDNYYDEEEEQSAQAGDYEATLEQESNKKEISCSELSTELKRLEEEQAIEQAKIEATELSRKAMEDQEKEMKEQEKKKAEEEKPIKEQDKEKHLETPPVEVEIEAPSDESARSSVERELDDELKLRIKRSSSLKCGKTPPDTPGRKKIVRFADALGLDLAAVRTFLEGVPNVPKSAFCDLQVEQEIHSAPIHGKRGSFALPSLPTTVMQNRRVLTPMFQQPGSLPDFIQRVREGKVCLENLTIGEDLSVRGIVRVVNICYHKSVTIRYTFDNWKNFHEATAVYVTGSHDGFSDRFSFLLWGSFLQPNGALIFCIRFTTKGENYWDNNKGANYILQCYSAPNPPIATSPPKNLIGRPQNDTNVHGGSGLNKGAEFPPFMDTPTTPTDPWATRFF